MAGLADFAEIIKHNEPLAPFTVLKLGGPAEMLIQPRNREQLAAVVRHCCAQRIPLHLLGQGCNVLVRDEGVRGAVLRLAEAAFAVIQVEGRRVRAGTGATLRNLIAQTTRNGLTGLETLAGVPGTVGGALRSNAGDRSSEIGQFVRRIEVVDERGTILVRDRDELSFSRGGSNFDDPVLLQAEFELEVDAPDAIVKRLRKAWIGRRASQAPGAGRIFKNPRGRSAAGLLEQAGLARTRVGGAEVSDRNPNYIIAHPGATARDVLQLIDLMRNQVHERFGVVLEREIAVW